MKAAALHLPALAEEYRERGFAVARGVFAVEELEPLRGCIGRAIDELARKLVADGAATALFADQPIERRLASLLNGREFGRQWDDPAFGPELHALASHPTLVAALAPLLGERIVCDGGYHLRPKMPESELTAFPWHQDSQYYGAGTEHLHVVTAWIPLIDVDEANGCLWAIPGSQRWGLLGGARGADANIRCFDDPEQRGQPEPVPMRRGDVLLFNNLTVHASKINRTADVRWSLDLRYSPDPAAGGLTPAARAASRMLEGKIAQWSAPFTVSGPGAPESFSTWRDRRDANRTRTRAGG